MDKYAHRRDWAGDMMQVSYVFNTLGAQVLIWSEFTTFTHNISLTECVWAMCGPRFGQSMDIRNVLSSCHDCMCIIDGFKWANYLQYSNVNNSLKNSHFTKPHTYLCSAPMGLQLWCKNFLHRQDPNKYNIFFIMFVCMLRGSLRGNRYPNKRKEYAWVGSFPAPGCGKHPRA